MRDGKPRPRDRVWRSTGLVLLYASIGVAGALVISRVFVGSFPWDPAPNLQVITWRTFDGFMSITFGFVLTIGVAMLLVHLFGRGMTCPRCGTRNAPDASACKTCDLPLPPEPTRNL